MKNKEQNQWYKDAIIYQAHVRAFQDSNDDGIGDFKGLITKLDYLKSLGVNAVWLLPFYKSPLKDGGYDIADFTAIHEDYGNMGDFKKFIREAHKRDLKVITELVLNHTSSDHKWFQRARNSKPGSKYRDFYVWNNNPDKYNDARIIFQDFEVSNWTWDHKAGAYYWHRFYSHQPDLNFDNPAVHRAVFKILDFWFGLGVDGLRLDAVPYLFEREGTNCENLPETHEYLKKLRKYIDDNFENKMLLAEANQWPEDASEYFGDGDECQMAFHFPLMPRLYMAMRMEDRFPIIDILEQTPEIPDNCQWSIFLRNHDELTLEMVSDEERDYMYKSFAQNTKQRVNLGIRRRLAPLLNNDRKNIELMNILLFSLPGTPIVYYGDEIGMGDNYYLGDRDGVRTPMQWSSDRNAGFSKAEPQMLYLPVIYSHDYHFETINVENNEKNPSSLLWWMRRIISKRKQYKAFGRGSIKFINADNPKVLAFIREYEDEKIMVLVNLSRYSQLARLDLTDYAGYIPVEVFSRNEFPQIDEDLYTFPLSFKNYFWFELRKPEKDEIPGAMEIEYDLALNNSDWNRMTKKVVNSLNKLLLKYINKSRWFRGKARKIRGISIADTISIKKEKYHTKILFVEIDYIEGKSENYIVPVAIGTGEEVGEVRNRFPEAVITDIEIDKQEGLLYDGTYDPEFRDAMINLIARRGKLKGKSCEITGIPGRKLTSSVKKSELPLPSKVVAAEQSNTSILYDNRFFFKIYRSPEEGSNPELELLKALADRHEFRHYPAYAGALEYRNDRSEDISLGILVEFIQNEGNAWELTQSFIDRYFDRLISGKEELFEAGNSKAVKLPVPDEEQMNDYIGRFFIEMVELLGKRTAEMHLALANVKKEKAFAPEPFSLLYQKSMYQSFRTLVKRTMSSMKPLIKKMPDEQKELAQFILDNETVLLESIKNSLEKKKLDSAKTRVHGDYHLGQVLFTGKDFIIIDFEGEPARSLTARKLKYCPFKDIAGMLRSFHYAIYMGMFKNDAITGDTYEMILPWLEYWYDAVSRVYIKSYLETADGAVFVPEDQADIETLISVFTIEKAIYEADYEMNNRPDWLVIPLQGLKSIINDFLEN